VSFFDGKFVINDTDFEFDFAVYSYVMTVNCVCVKYTNRVFVESDHDGKYYSKTRNV